jgi:apolipoprotein D and lipocalin family protein
VGKVCRGKNHENFFRMPSMRWFYLFSITLLGLAACSTSAPDGITPVTPFEINRYLGKWYEIARLDHSFERDMTDVSASYRLQSDGSVEVINRGFDTKRNEWRDAIGKAKFIGESNRASLKVSFFGPFYGGYHVVALDQQGYRWAMVAGPDRDYLWILARDRQLPVEIKEQLLKQAGAHGFETKKLIWVSQNRNDQ